MQPAPKINASIRLLLEHCPQLHSQWEQERTDRMDIDPGNPLPYMQAAALAYVVADAYQSSTRDCLPGLFGELEELLTAEAQPDRDVLVVGFIEDLQGTLGHAGLDTDDFYAMLGPKSRAEWDGLNEFWREVARKRAAGELAGPFDSVPRPPVRDHKLRKIIRGLYRPPH
jgi:hypothetical protein